MVVRYEMQMPAIDERKSFPSEMDKGCLMQFNFPT